MRIKKDPFLDKDFLYRLDQSHNKEVFAKIISLDFSENPIEEIVGRVSSGSISIDGNSAVRRTCSLTIVANKNNGEQLNFHEYYWGLSQKIRVHIGVKNTLDLENYPEIIWFPQGTFLITQFNTSQQINSYSISIQGKDKMALLNGEIGGNITSLSFDFGTEDYIDEKGVTTNRSLLIKDIIMEVVHEYAKEPYHNIIINDLDDLGLQLLEYRGKDPMYLIYDQNTDNVENMVFNQNTALYDKQGQKYILGEIADSEFDHRIELNLTSFKDEHIKFFYAQNDLKKENPKTVIKCNYGDVVGYRITDLTYSGDLIGQVGNPVTTSCFDKIIQVLGDFEYFYNLDGQFVFQRKKTYVNMSFNTLKNSDSDYYPISLEKEDFVPNKYYIRNLAGEGSNSQNKQDISIEAFSTNAASLYTSQFIIAKEWDPTKEYYTRKYNMTYGTDAADTSSIIYSFENSNLVTSFQNNPALQNVKNDFSIWGQRKSASSDKTLPVHMRYAIDKKPTFYKDFSGHKIYYTENFQGSMKELTSLSYGDEMPSKVDWREIIYQMAIDYSLHNHEDDFLATIGQNNLNYYPTGYTGYEQYYTDMLSFWRQLYDPYYDGDFYVSHCTVEEFEKNPSQYYWYKKCSINDKFHSNYNYYILDLKLGYTLRPTLREEYFNKHKTYYYIRQKGGAYDASKTYYKRSENLSYDLETHWSNEIINSPETLNFWFDFLDTDGFLSQYSCSLIGDRPKAINDDKVKAIYFRDVPNIIFTSNKIEVSELQEQKMLKPGYAFLRVPGKMEELFTISGQGQCAKDKLNSLLSSDACCAETVTINTIPVYYLEPNTRIFVRDDESGINGEYIINKISYNLGNANTMSVSATKALDKIY